MHTQPCFIRSKSNTVIKNLLEIGYNKVFEDECDKYGILYKMNDIIRAYKKKNTNDEQISLF